MLIAVTGGTGVLGRAVVAQLLDDGHEVRLLTRRERPRTAQVEPVVGDLADRHAIDRLVAGTDAILHLAYAAPEPGVDSSAAERFVQTNVVGTLRLIERAPSTRLGQLVFASSLAVYGQDFYAVAANAAAVLDETCPVHPTDYYGAHKAALEHMLRAAAGEGGMNTSAWRLGCVLAADVDPARDHLGHAAREARDAGAIRTRFGAFVLTAADAARVLAGALGDPSVRGRVFNTFDRWLDAAELAPILAAQLGRAVPVECSPAPPPEPSPSNARVAERFADWETGRALPELVRAALARG